MKRYWETSDFWKDAGERIVTAFIGGCLAVLAPVQFNMLSENVHLTWQAVVIGGGVSSVLSTVKAMIGAQRSGTTTPVSLL